MYRAFFLSLCLVIGISLTACFDTVPIFGVWRSGGLFGRDIEFQPDRLISGNQAVPATYETREGQVLVHLSNGRNLIVHLLDADHIRVDGTDFRRIKTDGIVASLFRVFTSHPDRPHADRSGSGVTGLFSYLAGFFQGAIKASDDGTAANHSLIAMILDYFGQGKDSLPAAAKTPVAGSGKNGKPAVDATQEVAGTQNPVKAPKRQPVPVRPANAGTRPPPEPVTELMHLPEGSWKTLVRYEASKRPVLSKAFLQGWFGISNCRVYEKDQNDEFAMAEHVKAAQRDLAATPVGRRYRIAMTVTLGEYDFEKKAFALKPILEGQTLRVSDYYTCPFVSLRDGLSRSLELRLDEDAPWQPSLPMAQDDARDLVQSLKTHTSRSVWADLVVDLEDVDGTRIDARPVALYLWKDDKRHVFLGALGRANTGSERLRKEPPPAAIVPSSPPAPAAGTAKSDNTASVMPKPQAIAGKARVIDTATLQVDRQTIKLDGIEGVSGAAAQELQSFIDAQGRQVECTPVQAAYRCLTKQGVNVAEAALLNGAARTTRESSERLRSLERQARNSHRGIWAK